MTFGHFKEDRQLNVPDGVEIRDVGLRREVLPRDLLRAGVRHGLVREMANRVHQAYGFPRAEIALTTGWLYGRDGKLLDVAYHGAWAYGTLKAGSSPTSTRTEEWTTRTRPS